MDNEILVKANNVSKKFCRTLKRSLWYGIKDVGGEFFFNDEEKDCLRPGEFWSVNDVSFELKRGECLGLIGSNGAGKSTILKLLNGLIKPDKGQINIRGRVGALIELGAGFNPILTGEENIYINGAVLGFTKEEINRKFNEIVDFAELEDFIDMPVQNYSSGMKIRLGFAVAAQMEPDVLIIDEVLAVGDTGFRVKCMNRIHEILKHSAVIFVSHAMPYVARLCTQVMVMRKGENVFSSSIVTKGIDFYHKEFRIGDQIIAGSKEVEVKELSVNGKNTDKVSVVPFGGRLRICISLAIFSKCHTLGIRLAIRNEEQRPVLDIVTKDYKTFIWKNDAETVALEIEIPDLRLVAGRHIISVFVVDISTTRILCQIENAASFIMGQHSVPTGCDIYHSAYWSKY